MESRLSGRTALYRYISSDGRLLYVGITGKPEERWEAHSLRPWAVEAAERTVEWFDARVVALHAEKAAIQNEKPVYNKVHNFETAPLMVEQWPSLKNMGRQKFIKLADLIRERIDVREWLPGQRLPSPHVFANAVEVSETTVAHAIQKLRDERYVHTRRAFGVFVSERKGDPRL